MMIKRDRAYYWIVLPLLGALGLAAGLLLPPWRGRPIPHNPPSEANRVFHPDGFSMVQPKGWRMSVSPDLILLSAGASKRSDFINVFRGLKSPADFSSFPRNFTFQGKPAYRRVHRDVAVNGDPYFNLDIVFERQGQIFEIIYCRWADPPPEDVPPEIQQYLESFRYDRDS